MCVFPNIDSPKQPTLDSCSFQMIIATCLDTTTFWRCVQKHTYTDIPQSFELS